MIKNKFLALESLRGIAAISVVFYHFYFVFDTKSHFNNAFVTNAWLMVDFFFVLSGFVIALNYIGKISRTSDLFIFQKKRFLRLYPLHLLMLLTFAGIEIAKFIAATEFGMVANNRAFSENNLTAFFANLFLVQNWVIPNLTFNYPSWSISAEFVTYALFGLLILLTRSNKLFLTVFLLVSIVIFAYYLSIYGMRTNNISGPLRCLYSFSIGVIAFVLYEKCSKLFSLSNAFIPALLLALTVMVVSLYGTKDFEYVVLIPILFGVTILGIVLCEKNNLLIRLLSVNWLVYLGTISYGIYMIHACVWWLTTQTLRFVLGFQTATDSEGKVQVVIDNVYVADVISIVGVVLVLFLAHVSHKYFEVRFRKLSDAKRNPW